MTHFVGRKTRVLCLCHSYNNSRKCNSICKSFIAEYNLFAILSIMLYTDVFAQTQIRRCVMKFCQIDKISTRTCIFEDAELVQIGQGFNSSRKQS